MKKINDVIGTKRTTIKSKEIKKTTKIFLSLRIIAFTVFSMLSLSACGEMIVQGDISRGEELSSVCAMCHGTNGISTVPIYPNLAGQKEQYLILQLKAFRSGERVNMAMTSHALKLSDQDIADLSAYYAQLNGQSE